MARSNQHQTASEAAVSAATEAERAGADILSITARVAEKSAEQFSQIFGVGRDGEQSAERYSRGLEALQECAVVAAKGYQDFSQEYLNWAQGQFQTTWTTLARLAQCRTPQEVLAAQNQLLGENVALALNANRRFAEIAKDMTDVAAAKISALAEHTEQKRAA